MALSPNEELTEKIVAALLEAGLVAEKHQEQLRQKLRQGTADDTDWRLWVESAIELAEKE